MGKAQVFYTDLMISVGIFMTAVVLFFILSDNLQPEESVFKSLVADSEAISSSLLSAGEPPDWAQDNVTKIGIVEDSYRLNANKAARLMNLSPSAASGLFGTNSNYVIFFMDKGGNVLNFNGCTFNNAGLVVSNISATICNNFTITPRDNLVSVERLVVYNAEIIKIAVQTWV